MTTIEQTGFRRLDAEGRLTNPVVKEPGAAGRFVFRGELAIQLPEITEQEKRPPTLLAQQVIAASREGTTTLDFFAGYLLSLESLAAMHDVLASSLDPSGKYFAFCSNVDLDDQFRISMGEATWYVLPLDESSVYAELLDLLDLEKNDLKKLSAAGKIDAIVDGMRGFSAKFEDIAYADSLERTGEARDPTAFGPV